MTDAKARRPRIDAILNGIHSGQYDDSISALQHALDERREEKKQDVERLVREIYGPDYQIVPVSSRKSKLERMMEDAPVPSEAPATISEPPTLDPLGPDDLGDDYESRSPLISGGPPA